MATAGEMSHLLGLQGTARERFARTLARREEQTQACQGCGKSFTATRDRERFCSPECCVAYHAAKNQPDMRTCRQCGCAFPAKRLDARLCSARCRKAQSRGMPAKEAGNPVTDNWTGRHTEKSVSPLHAALASLDVGFKPHPEEKEPAAWAEESKPPCGAPPPATRKSARARPAMSSQLST